MIVEHRLNRLFETCRRGKSKKTSVINTGRAVCNESCSHGSENTWGKSAGQSGNSPSFDTIQKITRRLL